MQKSSRTPTREVAKSAVDLDELGERFIFTTDTRHRVPVSQMEWIAIDCEMSHLNPLTGMPLNLALIHVDKNFNEVQRLCVYIKPSESTMKAMSDWARHEHGKTPASGGRSLLTICMEDGLELVEATRQVTDFIRRAGKNKPVVLVGSSVERDKMLLQRVFGLNKLLHYTTIDLTGIILLMERTSSGLTERYIPPNSSNHMALDDILSSLRALRGVQQMMKDSMR